MSPSRESSAAKALQRLVGAGLVLLGTAAMIGWMVALVYGAIPGWAAFVIVFGSFTYFDAGRPTDGSAG